MARQPRGIGEHLREWRARRRMSQLELALETGISTRHLSFLETGRAQPSRDMVLHLAERLDVPLRERNVLLAAAGYAPIFGERSLDDPARGARAVSGDRGRPALEPSVGELGGPAAAEGGRARADAAASQRAALGAASRRVGAAHGESRRVAGASSGTAAPADRAQRRRQANRIDARTRTLPGAAWRQQA